MANKESHDSIEQKEVDETINDDLKELRDELNKAEICIEKLDAMYKDNLDDDCTMEAEILKRALEKFNEEVSDPIVQGPEVDEMDSTKSKKEY